MVKNLPPNVGDVRDGALVPGPGRFPGEGKDDPSILARRIPWTEEPGGLQSIESQRV